MPFDPKRDEYTDPEYAAIRANDMHECALSMDRVVNGEYNPFFTPTEAARIRDQAKKLALEFDLIAAPIPLQEEIETMVRKWLK